MNEWINEWCVLSQNESMNLLNCVLSQSAKLMKELIDVFLAENEWIN